MTTQRRCPQDEMVKHFHDQSGLRYASSEAHTYRSNIWNRTQTTTSNLKCLSDNLG